MQFLNTLFWVLVAVIVAVFASGNWGNVPLNLWADIQADIKIPLLLALMFLLGFLPSWLILRARIWSLNRRIEGLERNRVASASGDDGIVEDGEETLR